MATIEGCKNPNPNIAFYLNKSEVYCQTGQTELEVLATEGEPPLQIPSKTRCSKIACPFYNKCSSTTFPCGITL